MKLIPLLFLMLLSSCSKVDTAMKFADWLIVKETDSYFDLTDEQNKDLKQEIQKDLARIKKDNFPKIAEFLRKVAGQVEANKFTLENLNLWHTEGQKTIKDVLNQFQPTALEFALKASQQQIEHFKFKYQKETDKRKKEIETDDDKFKFHRKRFEKWTDEWVGGLSADQRKLLNDDIKAYPFPWDLQIRSRGVSVAKFLEARSSKISLKAYMDKMTDDRDPEYETALKAYQVHVKGFILELYKVLTKEQKAHFIKKLRDRAQEFETLSREP